VIKGIALSTTTSVEVTRRVEGRRPGFIIAWGNTPGNPPQFGKALKERFNQRGHEII